MSGYLPPDNWVFDQAGRIIGEACHIIDLMTYFTGAKIKRMYSDTILPRNAKLLAEDNKTFVLLYDDGSLYTVIKNGRAHWPIPLWDIFQTSKASLIP